MKKASSDTEADTGSNLKRKIKTEESSNNNSTNKKVKDTSLFKVVRSSDIVGKNPTQMIQMLYNKKTKEPLRDKKVIDKKVNFILLKKFGKPEISDDITPKEIYKYYKEIKLAVLLLITLCANSKKFQRMSDI